MEVQKLFRYQITMSASGWLYYVIYSTQKWHLCSFVQSDAMCYMYAVCVSHQPDDQTRPW